jgi:Kef-type K+ transport system membrane component KefB
VGYIIIGILAGPSIFNIVDDVTVQKLAPFNMFALGLIGFTIGGELQYEIFKKYGKQFLGILFAEGLTAFVMVFVIVTISFKILLPAQSWSMAIALGLVLGAIASATAPAATVDVLWEYKTRGPLTRTILAIVALDDGLALILFGFASSAAEVLAGTGHQSLLKNILFPLWDIFGSILLGVIAGVFLVFIIKKVPEQDKILTFSLASVLVIIGLSITLVLDSILAAMALGATIANSLPRRSHSTFELVEKFTPPIYVLFFVLVGARLQFNSMPLWAAVLAGVYVIGRTSGKVFGSYLGARISKSPSVISKYLGICLFSQAGVAVGLSILAGQRFENEIGQAVILVVTASTFLVQIIGPGFVKLGVKKAGEVGKNITEEDLINSFTVNDVMDTEVVTMPQAMPIKDILKTFSTTDIPYYPVVSNDLTLTGAITIKGIKDSLANQGDAHWLVALDVMEPASDKTTDLTPLSEAMEYMSRYELDYMPVVDNYENNRLKGLMDLRSIRRKISAEVLTRRKSD